MDTRGNQEPRAPKSPLFGVGLSEYFDDESAGTGQPYLLPYGTPLTLSDFKAWTTADGMPGWSIDACSADGLIVTYQISPTVGAPMYATVTADGKSVLCRDVGSLRLRQLDRVTAWCDFILRTDAAGRRVAQRRAEMSDSPIESLGEIDAGFEDTWEWEENLANFKTIGELQAWLDDKFACSELKIEAFQVWPGVSSGPARDADTTLLCSREWGDVPGDAATVALDGSEGQLTPGEVAWGPRTDPYDWCKAMGDARARTGTHVTTSGSQFLSYEASNVIPMAWLQSHCRLGDIPDWGRSAWWGLHLQRTDLATVFPSGLSNLCLTFWNYGAGLHFYPTQTEFSERRNTARDHFERVWGRWLDPEVTLTPDELAEGVRHGDALLDGPCSN